MLMRNVKLAGLRPVTVYTRVFVGGRPVPIAIDVSCGTKRQGTDGYKISTHVNK